MYARMIVWVSVHRNLLWAIPTVMLWLAAYYWYLRFEIRSYFKRRTPQKWSVDMATRSIISGRKPLL